MGWPFTETCEFGKVACSKYLPPEPVWAQSLATIHKIWKLWHAEVLWLGFLFLNFFPSAFLIFAQMTLNTEGCIRLNLISNLSSYWTELDALTVKLPHGVMIPSLFLCLLLLILNPLILWLLFHSLALSRSVFRARAPYSLMPHWMFTLSSCWVASCSFR